MNQHRNILTHRIECLERESRRWRLAALVVGGVLGIAGLTGATKMAPTTDELRARRIVIVDPNDQERVQISVKDDGSAVLAVNDQEGDARVSLRVLRDGRPEVALSDKGDKPRIKLYLSELPQLLRGQGGLAPDPYVSLYYPDGQAALELRLALNEAPGLGLWDDRGNSRAILYLGHGEPKLVLRDHRGNDRAVLGHAELQVIRTEAVEQRPVSSLVLFDKDGKVLFKAP